MLNIQFIFSSSHFSNKKWGFQQTICIHTKISSSLSLLMKWVYFIMANTVEVILLAGFNFSVKRGRTKCANNCNRFNNCILNLLHTELE